MCLAKVSLAHTLTLTVTDIRLDCIAFDKVVPDADNNCVAAAGSPNSENDDPFSSVICKAATPATCLMVRIPCASVFNNNLRRDVG